MGEHTGANGIGHTTLYMKEGSLFCLHLWDPTNQDP